MERLKYLHPGVFFVANKIKNTDRQAHASVEFPPIHTNKDLLKSIQLLTVVMHPNYPVSHAKRGIFSQAKKE